MRFLLGHISEAGAEAEAVLHIASLLQLGPLMLDMLLPAMDIIFMNMMQYA